MLIILFSEIQALFIPTGPGKDSRTPITRTMETNHERWQHWRGDDSLFRASDFSRKMHILRDIAALSGTRKFMCPAMPENLKVNSGR